MSVNLICFTNMMESKMGLTVQRNTVDESFAFAARQNEDREASNRSDSTANLQVKSLMRHFATHAAMAVEKPPVAAKSPATELGNSLEKLFNNVKENADVKALIEEIGRILQKIIDGKSTPSGTSGECGQAGTCPLEQAHAGKSNAESAIDKMQLVTKWIHELFEALLNAHQDAPMDREANKPETRDASPFKLHQKSGVPASESNKARGSGAPENIHADSAKPIGTHQCEKPGEANGQRPALGPEEIAELVTLVILAIAPLLANSSNENAAATQIR